MKFLLHPYILLGVVGCVAVLGFVLIIRTLWLWLSKSQTPRCPKCDYDLRHLKQNEAWHLPVACVECGLEIHQKKKLYGRPLAWKRLVLGAMMFLPLFAPANLYWGYRQTKDFKDWANNPDNKQVSWCKSASCALDSLVEHLPADWTEKLREARWCERVFELSTKDFHETDRLSNLTHLKSLELRHPLILDMSALSNLTQLESLDLSGTNVSDISALSNLTSLKKLRLRETRITNISALSNLKQVEYLDLYGTNVSDISVLSNLTGLQDLRLEGLTVTDISALSNLPALRRLALLRLRISDISALSSLTQLESLYLRGTNVSDVSALSNLTGLHNLRLGGFAVSDISALSNLTQLKRLDLSGTQVSDISALSNLMHVENLNLAGMPITDVSTLSSLTQLKRLDLQGTQVTDISALFNLKQLRHLGLQRTKVPQSQIEAIRKALPKCYLGLRETGFGKTRATAEKHLPLGESTERGRKSAGKNVELKNLEIDSEKIFQNGYR